MKRRAVHLPHSDVAADVAPENVTHAVAVEVAGSDNRPMRLHSRQRGRVPSNRRAVHLPYCNIAAGVPPKNVALTVAVEVPASDDRPVGGHLRDTEVDASKTVAPLISHIAILPLRVTPENVGLAVTVEVADTDD